VVVVLVESPLFDVVMCRCGVEFLGSYLFIWEKWVLCYRAVPVSDTEGVEHCQN